MNISLKKSLCPPPPRGKSWLCHWYIMYKYDYAWLALYNYTWTCMILTFKIMTVTDIAIWHYMYKTFQLLYAGFEIHQHCSNGQQQKISPVLSSWNNHFAWWFRGESSVNWWICTYIEEFCKDTGLVNKVDMVRFLPVGFGLYIADVLNISPSLEQTAGFTLGQSAPTKG